MKKSVVILIFLIYVASIAIVGFLGLKAKTYNEVIYVEKLSILNEYKVEQHTGNKYIVFDPADGEEPSIKIECEVTPEDASNKKLIFKLDSDCNYATISEDGVLTFDDGITTYKSVTVYIHSDQNTTISDKLEVYYIP